MQKLDKFIIANIIANAINFQIRKHNLCELNFIKIYYNNKIRKK